VGEAQAIRTNAAGAMLGVSPSTLRSWERRYGFPRPQRSPGGHRQYALAEIEALRQALNETHNASSAIALAIERGAAPSSSPLLADAYGAYDEDRADRVLEESLAIRSLERTIEELLLDAVSTLSQAGRSPEYEFAWRHATGWLSAVKRLSPPATRPEGVLIFDSGAPSDLDALHAQALEIVLRRSGLRTLSLTTSIDPTRLGRALRALAPHAVVLAGKGTTLDAIGRLVYAVRAVANGTVVFDYRGAVPDTGASTVCRLGCAPVDARDRLLERLTDTAPALEPPAPARLRLRHL
jgi:MerR family transcriptional regulator, light-induced transcriptional regulator